MNRKIIFISSFLLILLVLIFYVFFITNKEYNTKKSIINIENKNIENNIDNTRKELFICSDLNCMENNYTKCEISQYFENTKEIVNSRGIAIFGKSDKNCNVIVSYDLKNSLKCLLPENLLNQDIFYKLWLSSLYKTDSSLEEYCDVDIVK